MEMKLDLEQTAQLARALYLILEPMGEVWRRDGDGSFAALSPDFAEVWTVLTGFADEPDLMLLDFDSFDAAVTFMREARDSFKKVRGKKLPLWYCDESHRLRVVDLGSLAGKIKQLDEDGSIFQRKQNACGTRPRTCQSGSSPNSTESRSWTGGGFEAGAGLIVS